MKKLLTILIFAVLTALPVRAAETADAEKFARDLADNIMTNVVRPKIPLSEKQAAFRKYFMTAINVKTNARFTLGQYAKTADPDQLAAYTDALADNIIYTWTDRFNSYAGDSLNNDAITFESTRKSEKGEFYVNSKIRLPNAENDVRIIWRISDKKGELKLADLVVEGVSMLMSYRNEYTAVLQQNGGDIAALIRMLKEKNDQIRKPAGK